MADKDPLLWPPEDDNNLPEVQVAPGQVPIFDEPPTTAPDDPPADESESQSSPRKGTDI